MLSVRGSLLVTVLLAGSAMAGEAPPSGAPDDPVLLSVTIRDGQVHELPRGAAVRLTNWAGFSLSGLVAGFADDALVLCSPTAGLKRIKASLILEVEVLGGTPAPGLLAACGPVRGTASDETVTNEQSQSPDERARPARAAESRRDGERSSVRTASDLRRWREAAAQDRRAVEAALGREVPASFDRYAGSKGYRRGTRTFREWVTREIEVRETWGVVTLVIGGVISAVGIGVGVGLSSGEDRCTDDDLICFDGLNNYLGAWYGGSIGGAGLLTMVVGAGLLGSAAADLGKLEAARPTTYSAPVSFLGAGPWIDREGKLRGASLGFRF